MNFKVGDYVRIGPEIFNTTSDYSYHKLYGKVFMITCASKLGYRLNNKGGKYFIFVDKEFLPVTGVYFHKLGAFYE